MPLASTTILFLACVLAAALVGAAVVWRRMLVMALPFLVVLDGLAVPLGGSSLHVDQLAACALVVPLAAAALIGARRLVVDGPTKWLAAILVMNVIASVAHSPVPAYSLRQCASLASVWVIYVVLLNFLDTREELDSFFRNVLLAAVLECAVAAGAYLLAIAGAPVGGAEVSASAAERFTNAYGAYGTMVEPNILGSFAAAHVVIAIVLLAAASQRTDATEQRGLVRWAAMAAGVGLLLSFTRAAWLGALAGALWFALVGARTIGLQIKPRRILIPLGIGVAAMVVVLLLPGYGGTVLRFKLFNLTNIETQTGFLRLFTYAIGLQQTAAHPIVGWGTFTFAPLTAEGADFQQFENWRNLWLGNFLLLALHDTGIIGLILWCGLLRSVYLAGTKATRLVAGMEPALAARTLALTAGVATLIIPFLSTTGFTLGYSWLLVGLLAAHARVAAATESGSPVTTGETSTEPAAEVT